MSGCRSRQDLTFQYPCSLRFPLQAGGTEPTRPTRFPSRSGGNLKEGGIYELWIGDWYNNDRKKPWLNPYIVNSEP